MPEIDPLGLVAWTVVVLALLSVPVLTSHEGARRWLAARLVAMAEHLRPVEEPDPLVEALRAQLRRERLVADVQRLRRLLARDEHMSAVRQIGNRMAYASLLLELEQIRTTPSPAYTVSGLGAVAMAPVDRWQDDEIPAPLTPRYGVLASERPPSVEVLELGPRRRTAS